MPAYRPPRGLRPTERDAAPTRPAASLMLLRDAPEGPEVLLVRRNPTAPLLGGFWVFPGGTVQPDDRDPLAAALRELLEETGLALGPEAAPIPFSRWITPAEVAPRFDAVFFAAAAPPGAEPRPDGGECVEAGWRRPADALAQHARGELALVFPTMKHLEQLAAFASVEDVLDAVRGRDPVPLQPRVVVADGTVRVLLPGDPGYGDPPPAGRRAPRRNRGRRGGFNVAMRRTAALLSATAALLLAIAAAALAGTLVGTDGADVLRGADEPDQLYGEGGPDQLVGGGGDDYLEAGPGADRVEAGAGVDLAIGGTGDDRLDLGMDGDVAYAGAGDDTVLGGPGGDTLLGQAGADRLFGGAGADRVYASLGADFADGGSGPDRISSEAGDAVIAGGSGDDWLSAGGGKATVRGEAGDDRIRTGAGNDAVSGGAGADGIATGAGDDRIYVRDGRLDVVRCGPGRDVARADRLDDLAGCERVERDASPIG